MSSLRLNTTIIVIVCITSFLQLADGFAPSTREKSARDWRKLNSGSNGSNGDHERNFLMDRWDAADKLEIRLDATVVSCHTLARFLSYDMTLPPKETRGFEIADIIMLLDTFTSVVVLSFCWVLAGLCTQLFEKEADDWGSLVQTAFLAAPPWLALELLFGWPAAGGPAVERIVLGTLGLMATTTLSRLVAQYVR